MHSSIRLLRSSLAFALAALLCGGKAECSASVEDDPCGAEGQCTGGGTVPAPSRPTSRVVVRVTPDAVRVPRLGTQLFRAEVEFPDGSTRTGAVSWRVREGAAGGLVTQEGEYSAPATPGKYHLIATSVDDPTAFAEIPIEVHFSLVVSPESVRIGTDSWVQFSAEIVGIDDKSVRWTLVYDETDGAVLTDTGRFLAIHEGEYEIMATSAADPSVQSFAFIEVSMDAIEELRPPVIKTSAAVSVEDSARFLYEGPAAPQLGVDPGVIEARRIAIVRGRVKTRSGEPLPGVLVSVHGHPEYGTTRTRPDGMYDIAVNGGERIVVELQKDGHIPVQRQKDVPVQDWTWMDDAVLVEYDAQATVVDLTASTDLQVVRGTRVADADGSRQATLLFPPLVQATLVMADGTERPITSGAVRATEFTVGTSGPAAMPGLLPPESAYTYAVEFSIDEAVAINASRVVFSQPVVTYVENFLGFGVGTDVPSAYYDRAAAKWVPTDDGLVIAVIGANTAGLAEIDVDGDGFAEDDAMLAFFEISAEERRTLAELYPVAQGARAKSLWRVPVEHFSPHDYNWPPPDDAPVPTCKPSASRDEPSPCQRSGSIIECENQTLGERVEVVGTPFFLDYRSARVLGRTNEVTVDLTQATLPAKLDAVELYVTYAGHQKYEIIRPVRPNMVYKSALPTKDVYGRAIIGARTVDIKVNYLFDGPYGAPAGGGQSFGQPGEGESNANARMGYRTGRSWRLKVLQWDSRSPGLGGWSLSAHHQLDPNGAALLSGDGSTRFLDEVGPSLKRVAGCLSEECLYSLDQGPAAPATSVFMMPTAIGHLPTGELLVADGASGSILKVLNGSVTGTLAAAPDDSIVDLAVGRGGDVYVASGFHVTRLSSSGGATVVAGTGAPEAGIISDDIGFDYDGGWAPYVNLTPTAIAVDRFDTLFVASTTRLRSIGADGHAWVRAKFADPIIALAPSPAGGAYAVAMDENAASTATDWTIWHVSSAARGASRIAVVKGPTLAVAKAALESGLFRPFALAVAPDGSIHIAASDGGCVQKLSAGQVSTVAGVCEPFGMEPTEGAANAGPINVLDLAFSPAGVLRLASAAAVHELATPYNKHYGTKLLVPSEDGSIVHLFDERGKHLETRDALQNVTLLSFAYDAEGRLASATDFNGRQTLIDRPASGEIKITSPEGIQTLLQVDAEGYATRITKPGAEAVSAT